MSGARAHPGAHPRTLGASPSRRRVTVVVGLLVFALGAAGLSVQAVRGNRIVGVQRSALIVHDADLDDAFYHCIDVQARSLVRPGEPVTLDDSDLADLVTLVKGVGSWATIADPASSAVARLSLHSSVRGQEACLGTVVTARYFGPGHRTSFAVGTGADVPGRGPPPAPPL